jgi:hypothetical protein
MENTLSNSRPGTNKSKTISASFKIEFLNNLMKM